MNQLSTPIALAKPPLPVAIDRNKLLGRVLIESLGFYPLSIAVAAKRNKYDALEQVMDWGFWLTLGFGVPWVLDRAVSRRYSNWMRERHGLPTHKGADGFQTSLMNVPFEMLEESRSLVKTANGQYKPEAKEALAKLAERLKLASPQVLEQLLENPVFRHELQLGKIGIMFSGLGLMSAKGQLYSWSKNWVTEKLSGKKGFAGEFNDTSAQFREQETAGYYQQKRKRQLISIGCGLGAAVAFPAVVYGVLRNKAGLNKLKGVLPRFNYTDGIFMPKEVFIVHTLFNFNLPTLLSTRTLDEFREKFVRCAAFDFFYYLGDDLIAGKVGQFLERRHPELKGQLTEIKRGFLGMKFTHAKPLEAVYETARQHTGSLAQAVETPLYKNALVAWAWGFAGTALGMGLAIPIINNIYTHHSVTKKQAAFDATHPKQNNLPAT